MKDITITYTQPTLRINNEVYEVRRTDAQIIQDLMEIEASASGETDAAALAAKKEALAGYLDRLLGAGARKRIEAGIPGLKKGLDLGLGAAVKLAGMIIRDAGRAYMEAFEVKYGEQGDA